MNIVLKYRRIYLLVLLIASCLAPAQAQTGPDTLPDWAQEIENEPVVTYDQAMNTIFGSLDQTDITSGLLYDRAMELIEFDGYQGDTTDSSLTYFDFQDVYRQVYQAHLATPALPSLEGLQATAKTYQDAGTIPVVVLDFEYQRIKESAFADELLEVVGNQIKDIFPRSSSPYETKRLFAVIPFQEYIPEGNQTFKVDQALYFTNTNRSLQEVTLTQGSATVVLQPGQATSVLVGSAAQELAAIYSNASLPSTSKVVDEDANVPFSKSDKIQDCGVEYEYSILEELCDPAWVKEVVPGAGTGRNKSSLACYPGCETSADTYKIRKPVLIIEGFDPDNARYFYLDPDKKRKKLSPEQHLYFASNGLGLCDDLRNRGHDILLFNCANGTGDIPTNAFHLIDAINWINAKKETNEEIIIIGASMGGLIARYALTKMEADGDDHKVKLLVTFDTPHRGANVAIGLQTALEGIVYSQGGWGNFPVRTEGIEFLRKRIRPLESNGAKQMLLYHYTQSPLTQAHPDFDTFHTQLENLGNGGYPVKCRKVAIACGSSEGELQDGMGFLDNLALINAEIPTGLFKRDGIYVSAKSLPQLGTTSAETVSQVLAGTYLINPLTGQRSGAPFSILNDRHRATNAIPYDNAPAGCECFHHGLDILKDYLPFNLNIGGIYDINPAFDAFVPTISALDLDENQIAMSDLTYGVKSAFNLNAGNYGFTHNSSLTPFDAVYVADDNTRHIINGVTPNLSFFVLEEEVARKHVKVQNRSIDYPVTISGEQTVECGREIANYKFLPGDVELYHGPPQGETEIVAGERVILRDGFRMSPQQGLIHIDPEYFDCHETHDCETSFTIPANKKPGGFFREGAGEVLHSIFEAELEDIQVFPNPSADGLFTVVLPAQFDLDYQISISDLSGREIVTQQDQRYNFPLDLSNYPKGVYLVTVTIDAKIYQKKIMSR